MPKPYLSRWASNPRCPDGHPNHIFHTDSIVLEVGCFNGKNFYNFVSFILNMANNVQIVFGGLKNTLKVQKELNNNNSWSILCPGASFFAQPQRVISANWMLLRCYCT
jgi:hypothetical protein